MEISSISAVGFGMPFRGHSSSSTISASSSSTTHFPSKSIKFSSRTRKSPKLQLQHTSDLPSTLTTLGQLLTIKDLNATLHHFANSNNFNHVSQVFFFIVYYIKKLFLFNV